MVCLTIGEGSTIDMEDLKGLQEDVYYFMILSFKELLYNSPTSHPLGNSQISNLVLKSQGHGESFQSFKFIPLVNQTASRMILKDNPRPHSLNNDFTMLMGKWFLTIHVMLHFSFKFL